MLGACGTANDKIRMSRRRRGDLDMCSSTKVRHSIWSLGQRLRVVEPQTNAESAIHLGLSWMNRAFSACSRGHQISGAMPQAESDMAPLALNTTDQDNRLFLCE